MGEGENGVSEPYRDPNEDKSAEQLEQKVELIREHLTDVVSELDYRRHEMMDVPGQLKKHAGLVAAIAGGATLLAGGAVGLAIYRSRRAAGKKVTVVKVKQYEGMFHRVLTAAAGAMVGVLVKTLAQKLMEPVLEGGEHRPTLPR